MRKFSIFLIMFTCLTMVACKKEKAKVEDEYIPKNETVIIQGKNGIIVTASDVYSKMSKFKRRIQIEYPEGNAKLPEIFISFESDDNDNIYKKFGESPNSISGFFLIETGGQVIYKKRIINGESQKGENIKYKVPGPVYDPNVACTVSTVHNCVSWEIEDMNWIEYGACLISAPGCYATLWASCTWEVCHNHIRYTNPI